MTASPRAVLITGASTGIGRASALRMDAAGWRVFAGVRKEADGAALQAAASPRLTPVQLDVTDPEQIGAVAEQIAGEVGANGLHGLVNNAGISAGGLLEFMDVAELRRVLEVNAVAQLAVTQPLIPLLRRAPGRIVMMSSMSGFSATPLVSPYSASKFALEALTDGLRLELHPWGIRVVSIQPGTIQTEIWRKALAFVEEAKQTYPPEAFALYGPLLEMMEKRLGRANRGIPAETAAETVHAALTVARPRARYLVGRDARMRRWIERLPTRLRDRLILGRMPEYGKSV